MNAPHRLMKILLALMLLPMTAAALGTEVLLPTLEAERDDFDPEQATVRVSVPSASPNS